MKYCDECDGTGFVPMIGRRLTGDEIERVPCRPCKNTGRVKEAPNGEIR